ncbi:conserved hypothetical protein [delta proteobacterium NaphS2]|nr:conserved hypothetical protein [delta proteobacterium NaphS2]
MIQNKFKEEMFVKKPLLLVLGLISIAVWGEMVLAQEHKGPRLAVEGREFDFKEVKEGVVLEHTFKILNKGDESLKILSVRPG